MGLELGMGQSLTTTREQCKKTVSGSSFFDFGSGAKFLTVKNKT